MGLVFGKMFIFVIFISYSEQYGMIQNLLLKYFRR